MYSRLPSCVRHFLNTVTNADEFGHHHLILPSERRESLHSARLESLVHQGGAASLYSYHRRLDCTLSGHAYVVVTTTTPGTEISTLSDRSRADWQELWAALAYHRHVEAPLMLSDLNMGMGRTLIRHGYPWPRKCRGNPPYPVYQPQGIWQFLPPRTAYDLRTRASLQLPVAATETPTLADFVEVLGNCRLFLRQEQRMRFIYDAPSAAALDLDLRTPLGTGDRVLSD